MSLVEDAIDGLADRHRNAQTLRKVMHFPHRVNTLGNMPEPAQYLRQIVLLRQQQTDLAIARQIAGAGQDQIPHAG